jgi:hypothetical protein
VARVKASVGVAFQGEWTFRARATAFEWMLRVGPGRNRLKALVPLNTFTNPCFFSYTPPARMKF